MRVYVNLDSREFVVSPVLLQRVSTLFFTRRDLVPVQVQFVRGGTVVELASGATGQMGIKKTFAGSFLANDTAWSKSGTGTATVYQFDLNLNTTGLNSEFATDTEASIAALVEIEWSENSTTSSTLPTAATIYNDVIRGGEAAPTITSSTSFQLLSADASVWTVTIDNSGVLTATK